MYKTIIQLVLLLILVLIIFFISKKYFNTENKIDIKNNSASSKIEKNNSLKNNFNVESIENEITNLTFEKFDTGGNKYLIKAQRGKFDSESQNIIYMKMVEASLMYQNNDKITIYSKEAIFNKENFKTTFSNNVKLTYKKQILKSDILEFLIDKNIAIFKDNVKYYDQDFEAFGDAIVINLLTKTIDIKSNNKKKIRVKKN